VIEDMVVVEAAQRGLSSGALTELVYSDGEIGCRHLLHAVRAVVEGRQTL
jgi:hypothetical protein